MRPGWDTLWMGLASNISKRSCDPRLQVGCVIVTDDNSCVLSVGYNGMAAGEKNEVDSTEPGQSGAIHAEVNALIKLPFGDFRQRKMYLTHSPCAVCARAIVNAGIKDVYYIHEYRIKTGLEILEGAGINIYLLQDT